LPAIQSAVSMGGKANAASEFNEGTIKHIFFKIAAIG
jgi:hypothetical protein